MARDGAAVIIEVREWGYHWTVVRGVTEKSLLLLDSAGVKTIRLATCQAGGWAEEGMDQGWDGVSSADISYDTDERDKGGSSRPPMNGGNW